MIPSNISMTLFMSRAEGPQSWQAKVVVTYSWPPEKVLDASVQTFVCTAVSVLPNDAKKGAYRLAFARLEELVGVR